MKKVLLIDMDGVLCRYNKKILTEAYSRYGLPLYQEEDISIFDTHEIFDRRYQHHVENIALEKGFFSSLLPVSGAVEAFQEIIKESLRYSFDVCICTTPKRFYKNQHCLYEKADWVSCYLGKEHTDRIVFARDKTLVRGTVLVDDKPIISGSQKPEWTHILFDTPYNRAINQPRLTSWRNWREVLLPYLT